MFIKEKRVLKTDGVCLVCGASRKTKGLCNKCYIHMFREGTIDGKTLDDLVLEYSQNQGYQLKGELKLRGSKDIDEYLVNDGRVSREDKYGSLNHEAFSLITPNSAYYLGLLITDGCISQGQVEYLSVDKDIVDKFALFMNLNPDLVVKKKKIKSGYAYRLRFKSSKVIEDLASYGIVPNKSLITDIVEPLRADVNFLRGVLDGDGTIYLSKTGCPIISFYSSSPLFLDKLQQGCDSLGFKSCRNRLSERLEVVNIAGSREDKARFLFLLYEEGPAIDRKRAKAKEVIGKYYQFR